MQIRTVLAIAAWSLVAIAALGQAQQKIKNAVRKAIPAAEGRIDQLQKGFQSALDDLSQTKTREILTHDENGKLVKMKVAASFRHPPDADLLDRPRQRYRRNRRGRIRPDPGKDSFYSGQSAPEASPSPPARLTLHKDTATDAPQIAPAEQKQIEAFASTALCPPSPTKTSTLARSKGTTSKPDLFAAEPSPSA